MLKKFTRILISIPLLVAVWQSPLAAQTQPVTVLTVAEERGIAKGGLPNGVVSLPDWDQARISILSFSQSALKRNPFSGDKQKPRSRDAVFARMREAQAGDITYDDAEGGTILVWSALSADLGEGLLADLSQLDAKMAEKQDALRIKVGRRYMVRTLDGKYAVFRVLAQPPKELKIQWIYQPDGTTKFASLLTFLDKPLGNIDITFLRMNDAVTKLREQGIGVCFEVAANEPAAGVRHKVELRDATVRAALDALVAEIPEYVWRPVTNTGLVMIQPKSASKLQFTIGVALAKEASWVECVKGLNLEQHDIQFSWQRAFGLVKPPPSDKVIPLELSGKETAGEALAILCWAYGGNMAYDLWPEPSGGERKNWLYFTE